MKEQGVSRCRRGKHCWRLASLRESIIDSHGPGLALRLKSMAYPGRSGARLRLERRLLRSKDGNGKYHKNIPIVHYLFFKYKYVYTLTIMLPLQWVEFITSKRVK
jgi:hypothetical protein